MNIVSNFTLNLAERVVRAAATSGLTYLTISGVLDGTFSAGSIHWLTFGGYIAGGAIYETLLSLGAQPIGDPITPSVLKAQGTTPATASAPPAP